jgi:hypothetical protein
MKLLDLIRVSSVFKQKENGQKVKNPIEDPIIRIIIYPETLNLNKKSAPKKL